MISTAHVEKQKIVSCILDRPEVLLLHSDSAAAMDYHNSRLKMRDRTGQDTNLVP